MTHTTLGDYDGRRVYLRVYTFFMSIYRFFNRQSARQYSIRMFYLWFLPSCRNAVITYHIFIYFTNAHRCANLYLNNRKFIKFKSNFAPTIFQPFRTFWSGEFVTSFTCDGNSATSTQSR